MSSLYLSASAQRIVTDARSCSRCEINLTLLYTFQTESAPGGLAGLPTVVVRLAQQRWAIVAPGQLPLIFNRDGSFLRQIGRTGDGPGEFRSISAVVLLPGDSVLILDTNLMRASVLRPDLTFARSISLPVRAGAVAVMAWPTNVIVNGVDFSSQLAGVPLHMVDFSKALGRLIRSFGDDSGTMRAGETAALARRFFGVTERTFWTSHVVSYRFTRYSSDGTQADSLKRQTEWFVGTSPWSIGSPTQPPPPAINGVASRRDTAWIAARLARPDWKNAWRGVNIPQSGELSRARAPARTDLYRSVIEAIDLKGGSLIAQKFVNGIVVHIDAESAVVYDSDQSGTPRLRYFAERVVR